MDEIEREDLKIKILEYLNDIEFELKIDQALTDDALIITLMRLILTIPNMTTPLELESYIRMAYDNDPVKMELLLILLNCIRSIKPDQ